MIATFTPHRKPLRNVPQQQNNRNLQNNFNSITKHPKTNSTNHAKLFAKESTEKKSKKILQNTNEKENRNIKYSDFFQRTPQQWERQEQNCQNYFLRKTIMTLYKLFQSLQFRWNLYELNYPQLLKILHELHYIRFDRNDEINEKTSSDLKKCYWIWVNISEGKTFSLCNLIIILFCIEHLEYDLVLIEDIVKELTKGIEKFEQDFDVSDSKYIFLVKNQRFRYSQGLLQLGKVQIQRIQIYLKELRLNRLMESHHHTETEKQSEQNISLISKRSEKLAQTKRQKILKEIKEKQPHVKEIELYHILNYKTNRVKQRRQKTQNGFIKKDKRKQGKKLNKSIKPPKSKSTEKQSHKLHPPKLNTNTRQSIELQFDQFYSEQLKKVTQKQHQPKYEIVDQLEWDQIPKVADQMKMEFDLLESKDDFTLCQPLSHTFSKIPQDKQRKRKEYLDLPILFVDVNIEEGKKQRIVIYEGDKASDLAVDFGKKHKLNEEMILRLENLLQLQIGSVLTKIDESNEQDCSQLY